MINTNTSIPMCSSLRGLVRNPGRAVQGGQRKAHLRARRDEQGPTSSEA